MKRYQIIPVLLANIFISFLAGAQESNILWALNNTSRVSCLNPAYFPEKEAVVGVPLASGFGYEYHGNFKLNDFFESSRLLGDTMKFDFSKMYRVMDNRASADFSVNASMFFFGFRKGKNFFSVSVNEKGYLQGSFDKAFVRYFYEGNKGYFDEEGHVGTVSYKIVQYRELALGFSRRNKKAKFSYGGNLKFLFGRMNLNASEIRFSAAKSDDGQALQVIPEGEMKISGPIRFETDTLLGTTKLKSDMNAGDYFFNLKNLGISAGAGIEYRQTKGTTWFFSITDLGFIPFANKTYMVKAENTLTYKKSELTQSTNPDEPDYLSPNASVYAFRDSIPSMITAERTGSTLWEFIPANIYMGAMFKTGNRLTLGFVQHLQFQEKYFLPVSTISVKKEFSKNWAIVGAWSVIKSGFINPGAGITYTADKVQFYMATDNILSAFRPSSSKNVNLQLGLNLFFEND